MLRRQRRTCEPAISSLARHRTSPSLAHSIRSKHRQYSLWRASKSLNRRRRRSGDRTLQLVTASARLSLSQPAHRPKTVCCSKSGSKATTPSMQPSSNPVPQSSLATAVSIPLKAKQSSPARKQAMNLATWAQISNASSYRTTSSSRALTAKML